MNSGLRTYPQKPFGRNRPWLTCISLEGVWKFNATRREKTIREEHECLIFVTSHQALMVGFCVSCTYLAPHVPHGDGVVVRGVSSGASWIDPTEFVHIVVDVCSSCRN